jgi:hypothetical protein
MAPVPLEIPFDFSRHELAISATINGRSLHMLLDTGVDPSVIDLESARSLGLRLGQAEGGVSGTGSGEGSSVYPATLAGLAMGARAFHSFAALAYDLRPLSARYGSQLDGILGYSFLSDKTMLIDYDRRVIDVLEHAADAGGLTRGCRRTWTTPLALIDNFPAINAFRFGGASAPVTLDTGANSSIALYPPAMALSGVHDALVFQRQTSAAGFRGAITTGEYGLNLPLGFGPFALPAGQAVTVREGQDEIGTRAANIGNPFFAALHLKMLLDYPGHRLNFFGGCSA